MASISLALECDLCSCSSLFPFAAKSENIGSSTYYYYFQGRFRGMQCTDLGETPAETGARGRPACSFRGGSRAGLRGADLRRTVPGIRRGTKVER